MNWRSIRTIIRKDLLMIAPNKGVWMPIIIVPLVLLILLPTAAVVLPRTVQLPTSTFEQISFFVEHMPEGLRQTIAGLNDQQIWVVVATIYFFAPFFLIIPVMVSSVIGADSFAGEKERKTLEALLYTPTTDAELFVGKVLTALLPGIAITWLSFLLYTLVVNIAGRPVMGYFFFPNWMWVVLMLWVAPAAAGLALSVMVLVSSKAKSFQEANQLGSMVVLPIVLLVFGQIAGVIYFSVPLVLLVGLVLWAIDAVLIFLGVRTFARAELIARL